jgi:Ca2+-binding EF-hand superfamily protein
MLRTFRKSTRAGQKQQSKVALDARAIKTSEEDFAEVNRGIVSQLFKDKELIGKEDIINLQAKFKEDLWRYEFA